MSAGTLAPVRGQFADACANWRRNEAWTCVLASCAWDAGTSCPAHNKFSLSNKNYVNVCGNIPVKPVTGAGMRRGNLCMVSCACVHCCNSPIH